MAKIVVIGSGLSGLSAALHLSAAQHHVVILESKQRIGGRGTSEMMDNVSFGFGPHVLLKNGPTHQLTKKLSRVRLYTKPIRLEHIQTSNGPLRPNSYTGIAEFRRSLKSMNTEHHAVRCLQLLATYGIDHQQAPERINAYAKSKALVTAKGWAGIIGRLAGALDEVGVYVETNCRVTAINETTVQLEDGRTVDADAVVLACGISSTKKLLSKVQNERLQPIETKYASTIDVALFSNPMGQLHAFIDNNERQFVLHLSKIQPRMIHPGSILSAAKLLSPSEEDALEELSQFLDSRFAGWDQHVMHIRRQKKILMWAKSENTEDMFGKSNIFLAGDWLTSEYLFSDAAVESGRIVASKIQY